MPSQRRKDVFDPDVVGVYHCTSRCVRGAFLCGVDQRTGRNYQHRKRWIYNRLRELVTIFTVDVLGHDILDNHYHVILRNRPDLGSALAGEEVVRRWRWLYPHQRNPDGTPKPLTPWELKIELRDTKRVAKWRRRLSDLSWFMKSLNERIAVLANAEDEVRGHFFQERFKCKRLLDAVALLACCIYVDLNEIRADVAQTPEESAYTSVFQRIQGRFARLRAQAGEAADVDRPRPEDMDYWLCPISESVELEVLSCTGQSTQFDPAHVAGRRLARQGMLEMKLEQYLSLLDWTGRQRRGGKAGAIPQDALPILERLQISVEHWAETALQFERLFPRVAGTAEHLMEMARRKGRQWYHGLRHSRKAFG